MKLNLLLATSLLTGAAFGQFTQANEPTIGTNVTMHVLDSNAVNYDAVIGTGVTWDYSTTPGITGATKNSFCYYSSCSELHKFNESNRNTRIYHNLFLIYNYRTCISRFCFSRCNIRFGRRCF